MTTPKIIGILIAGLFLAHCSEAVEPFTDTDRYFTVFGFLDTGADTQYLRVVPLRQLIDVPPPGALDATVTTTEMETGRTITWSDSLVFFSDESFGHVFKADFKPIHGYTYTLEIRRSDGQTTRATTQVPANREAVVLDPIVNITGAGTRTTQRVNWANVDFEPFSIQVWYRFAGSRPDHPFREVALNYTDTNPGRFLNGGWEVSMNLNEDRRSLFKAFGLDPDQAGVEFRFPLYGIGMQLSITDSQWRPPGGIFDPEVLAQPGAFSNVEHGFGFFGSVAQLKVEWTLAQEMVEALGYPYPQELVP